MTWKDILKVKRTTKLLNAKKVKEYIDKRMAKYPDSPPSKKSIANALNMSLDDVEEAYEIMEGEYEDLPTRLQKFCEMHRNDPEPIPIPMKEEESFEKKLFGNQKKIAEQAPPKNKIDGKDLKVLQAKKKLKSRARSVFTKR